MRESMRKLADKGVSVIVVTHHLPDIIPEIRRVIALKQGRIFFDGEKRELLNPKRMEELFDAPVGVEEEGGYYTLWLES
jgi:iron complex transport system ATP-binding protein